MRNCRVSLCLSLLLVFLAGCGWGGDPRDFSLTITPTSMDAAAGSAGPAVSLLVERIFYFDDSVTVTFTPPAGMSCSLSPCVVKLTDRADNAVRFTPSATLAAGTYTVPWTAESTGVAAHKGSLTIRVSAPSGAGSVPDFNLAVTPGTSSVVAGAPAQPYSFAVTRSNGQTAAVRVTATLPTGVTCSLSPCTVTISGTSFPNAFTLQSASTLAAGTYTVSFTGTDGTNTHTVTSQITVAAAVTSPPVVSPEVASGCMTQPYQPTAPTGGSHLDFVYTGAQNPLGLVYDAVHNLVFESNDNLNEVDVIDPNAMKLIHRIPVPAPTGLDLTPDGKTLLVGTFTPAFYRVDTGTFCVTGREEIQVQPYTGPGTSYKAEFYPRQVLALADGTVALWMAETSVRDYRFYLWDAPGTIRQIPVGTYVGGIMRSSDRLHVFAWSFTGGIDFGRYDVATRSTVARSNFSDHPFVYAVNGDGSRILTTTSTTGVALRDANFNVLKTGTASVYGTLSSPDLSRLYGSNQNSGRTTLTVLDGQTLQTAGLIPGLTDYAHINSAPKAFDGTGRILATAEMGLGVIPVRAPAVSVRSMGIRSGYAPVNSGLSPDDSGQGLFTTVNGSGFVDGPSVFFDGVAGAGSALKADPYFAGTAITTTAPRLDTDCVNVEVSYADVAAMEPLSYCYRPRVLYHVGDAGPSAGGTTLSLYGMGLGDPSFGNASRTRVRIGGVDATNVQVSWNGYSPYALQLTILTVTVPPGRAGKADIEIISTAGTTVLPGAFTYADVTETALPAGADPYEMILDKARDRILISDAPHRQILVYSTTAKSMQAPIALDDSPRGIVLTPDGARLLVAVGANRLVVLNADTYSVQKQVTLPASAFAPPATSEKTGLFRVVALAGNRVFLLINDFYDDIALWQYDLQTDLFQRRNDASGFGVQGGRDASASDDGLWAIASSNVYDAANDRFNSALVYSSESGTTMSPDGTRFATPDAVYDRLYLKRNLLSNYDFVTGMSSSGFAGAAVPGGRFNAGTSLFFQPVSIGSGISSATQPAMRIWDVAHGKLSAQMSLPGSQLTPTDYWYRRMLAVDPGGQRAWMITSRGLQDIQFAQDPLTIGTVTVSNGVVTAKGSGFTSTVQARIDGQAVTVHVTGTTQFTATLPALAAGAHTITLTDGTDRSYILDLAFTTP